MLIGRAVLPLSLIHIYRIGKAAADERLASAGLNVAGIAAGDHGLIRAVLNEIEPSSANRGI